MIRYFFTFVCLCSLICACSSYKLGRKSHAVQQNDVIQDTLYWNGPEIFHKKKSDIIIEIQSMFLDSVKMYERFSNKGIVLTLFCDTLTCRVDSILVDRNSGFNYYSNILTQYFLKMSPINCKHEVYNKRVSEYTIFVGDRGNGLQFEIDYGYRVER